MDKCVRCGADLPEGAKFCPACGRKQQRDSRRRNRGNGTGTAYQMPNKTWKAVVTLGYELDPDHHRKRRITRSKGGFRTKTEALEYLPELRKVESVPEEITFKALYDRWLPLHENKVSHSTMLCYQAAMNPIQEKNVENTGFSAHQTATGLQRDFSDNGRAEALPFPFLSR